MRSRESSMRRWRRRWCGWVRNLDAHVERSDMELGLSGQRMWVLP
jgi:hypothetical protein